MPLTDAEILTYIYKNFDPAIAASDDFYVDCTDVRGGSVFVDKLCTALTEAQDPEPRQRAYIHALFAGYSGGGKSSELRHLQDKMQDKNPPASHKRFLPIFIDMRQYLDDFDAAREEILLAIVAELARVLEEREKIVLANSYLVKRFNEIKRYFLSDVEINEGEIDLPGAHLTVQRLRTSPEARDKIRKALQGQTSTLLQEINTAFPDARIKLRKHKPLDGGQPYTDFVLIVDALDRLYGYGDKKTQDESQRALFVDDASVLTGLYANCVFTVSLSTMRASETQLTSLYNRKPFLLPMIKIESRGNSHAEYTTGRKRLAEILEKRIPPSVTLPNVFEDDALDFLITYSGGHVRSLLMYARESTLYGERTLPITLASAQLAVAENITFNSPKEGGADWERLAALEAENTQEWHTQNENERRLLEQLFVLEYINGGDEDPFNKMSPWYAVHPIVRQLNPFKRALQKITEKK